MKESSRANRIMIEFIDESGGKLTVRAHKFRDDRLVIFAPRAVDLNESDVANLLNVLKGFLKRKNMKNQRQERS